MIFNFLVLINLALVNTIGSSNLSLNSYLRDKLPDNCLPVVENIINFDSCQVPEGSPIIKYGMEAVPYVCLLSLDVAAELCKEPELWKKLSQQSRPKFVCPMGYALETSNLKINITRGRTYMSEKNNCDCICGFSPNLFNACEFIALANEIIKEGKSIGEHLDRAKADDNQPVHEKYRTDSVTGGGGIGENPKLAQETKPKDSPKLISEIVQSLTDNKSVNNTPVTKTEGVTVNKITNSADLSLKPDLESKGPDGSIYKNNSYKAVNDSYKSNVSVNKTVLKNGTSKNNDNYKIKLIEISKSQDLASNKGNTDIPGTESLPPPPPQLPLENDYSSKNQQNNVNINNNNNNVNSNNNNMEFEDDPALKTPHEEGEDDDDNNNEDMDKSPLQDTLLEGEPQFAKSVNQKEIYSGDNFFQAEDSHFSVYFLTSVSIIIVGYVIYHNKKKILAYALEGRRNKNGRRRPTSASYRKLDCNLEEAIASNPSNTSVTNVVY